MVWHHMAWHHGRGPVKCELSCVCNVVCSYFTPRPDHTQCYCCTAATRGNLTSQLVTSNCRLLGGAVCCMHVQHSRPVQLLRAGSVWLSCAIFVYYAFTCMSPACCMYVVCCVKSAEALTPRQSRLLLLALLAPLLALALPYSSHVMADRRRVCFVSFCSFLVQ